MRYSLTAERAVEQSSKATFRITKKIFMLSHLSLGFVNNPGIVILRHGVRHDIHLKYVFHNRLF